MSTIPFSQYGQACRQAGFTLIELITAITIMAILSTIGIASFVTYSRIQTLSNATQELTTTLQLAKASASSQVKPTTCDGSLRGYYVTLNVNQRQYKIFPQCDGPDTDSEKIYTLPTNVEIEANGTTSVLFKTITGDVVVTPNNTSITLSHAQDESRTKTITVNPTTGRIAVQ